jgi:hypothetical protein
MANKKIDTGNYEEFFLLYLDNELSAADRASVEAFAASHPALQEELELLLDTRLKPETHSFAHLDLLLKPETSPTTNRRTVLLRWLTPAAAAILLISVGLSRLQRADDNLVDEPPIILSQQQPVSKPAQPSVEIGTTPTNTPISEKQPTKPRAKRDYPVINTDLPAPKPLATSLAVETPVISEKVIKLTTSISISESTEQPQTASSLADVKTNYATEALLNLENEDGTDDVSAKPRKGFRGLVRKATRIYQKITEPEEDKPLIRLAKADLK